MKTKTGMKKRLLSLGIALGMLLGLGCAAAVPALAADSACAEDGCVGSYVNGFCTEEATHYQAATLTENKYDLDGDEQMETVYEIANAGQLYWFANEINTSTDTNAILTADIVVNENVIETLTTDGQPNENFVDDATRAGFRQWTPIGTGATEGLRNPFNGTFDGNGHTISGLYLNTVNDYKGLFGVFKNGAVKNLGVTDSFMRQNGSTSMGLGAIIGCVLVDGSVTLINCFSENNYIYSGLGSVGGLVGMTERDVTLTIQNSYNTSTVRGWRNMGGLIGEVNGAVTIEGCWNSGAIRTHGEDTEQNNYGGLVGIMQLGTNTGVIRNSYSVGEIQVKEAESSVSNRAIGGLVGYIGYTQDDSFRVTIENCFVGSNFDTDPYTDAYVYADVGKLWDPKSYADQIVVTNLFYPNGMTSNWRFTTTDEYEIENATTTEATVEDFASGSIALALQAAQTAPEGEQVPHVWGQRLSGDNADAFPVLGGQKVYLGYVCDEGVTEMVYTNQANASADAKPSHTMTDATCTEPPTCTFCAHTSGEALGHAWNEGAVTTQPTCTEKGVKTFTCTRDASHTEARDVSALGHKYDNDCDGDCNTCSAKRTPAEHADTDKNDACDVCGAELPKKGLPVGAIVGIVIGAVVLLGGGGFALYWFVIRKKRIVE